MSRIRQSSTRLRMRAVGVLVAVCAAAVGIGGVAEAASSSVPPPNKQPFYRYTGNLKKFKPGQVIRTRTIKPTFLLGGSVPLTTTKQVLYRTTTSLGKPTVAVATIMDPIGAKLLHKNKLISWQTAYDGLTSTCDPSYAIMGGAGRSGVSEEELMVPLLVAGYPIVTADYEGEDNAFADGTAEGYGTLDGIRAAEHVLHMGQPSTAVALTGYSGGAIASDWAAQLAPKYAPSVDIVGAAMGGVAVDLEHNLSYVNGSEEWSGAIPAALIGIARGYHIDLKPYLSAYGARLLKRAGHTCLGQDLGKYPGLTYQKMLKRKYNRIDHVKPVLSAMNRLIMGPPHGTPREPLLIGVGIDSDGIGDGVMVARDDEALAHAYCRKGLAVRFSEYRGLNHTEAVVPFMMQALPFVVARLSGLPATNGCSSIGKGNSLAPEKYVPLKKKH